MTKNYQHLSIFSNLVQAVSKIRPLFPLAAPGIETQQRVQEVLGFSPDMELPGDVKIERQWERDGLQGEEISWSVGYGPPTYAWLLKPIGASQQLPGVVALHDHGGFKFYGKEKITDGPTPLPPIVEHFRVESYGGRAFANALAKEGFVVLIPDTFLWGSRRFPLESIPLEEQQVAKTFASWWFQADWPDPDIVHYNAATSFHEHLIEKYCSLMGTTLAGIVSYEDRVAVNYLASRPEVISERIGCIGLSGGGCRAALLQATSTRIAASVIVGMMSTYEHLLDHNVASHTWMFFPSKWASFGDWPDLAACRAPSPLLVQYDLDDELFTEEGMRAAHRRLAAHYQSVGQPGNYVGEFYPGPHQFDLKMQISAFSWLKENLSRQVAQ